MNYKISGVFCALLLCACSDQTQVDKTIQINNPLEITPNFKVVNSSPSSESGTIPIVPINLNEIRLQIADSLIPSTITEQSVYLQPVSFFNDVHSEVPPPLLSPLELNYSNGILLIKLKQLLSPSTDYHLLINGVSNRNGDKLIGHVVPFRTMSNPVKSIVEYSKTLPRRRMEFQNNALGEKTQLIVYDTYGTIDTRDDFIITKTEFNTTLGQRLVNEVTYDASGSVMYYQADIWEGNAIVAHALFNKPGANLQWGDNDDEISQFTDSTHIQEHYRLNRIYVANPANGNLPIWQNKAIAFAFDHAVLSIYDRYNTLLETITYKSLGQFDEADTNALGEPTPLDDEIESYTLYKYDTDENQFSGIGLPTLSETRIAAPGKTVVDLKGNHGNDFLAAYQTFIADDNVAGRIKQSNSYVKSSGINYDPKQSIVHEYVVSFDPTQRYILANTKVLENNVLVKEIQYDIRR